jgi:signal peptidase I
MTAPLDEDSGETPAPAEPRVDPEPGEPEPGEPEPAEAAAPEAKGARSGTGWVIEIVETLVLTLVIFLVIQNFIAQPFEVRGSSMETTFLDGQYVLVDRLSHAWTQYARGEVIVFHPPDGFGENGYPFIKRIIAVAGDTVAVHDGKVFVNGTALDEPYTYRDENGVNEPTEPLTDTSSWSVPPGDLFVMGDHRQASEDGRAFGPIPISSVIGRVLIRYWPLSAFGPIPAASPSP